MRVVVIVLAFALAASAMAGDSADPRYCGVENIVRNDNGKIHRSAAEVRRFRSWWACPETQMFTGACPGWGVDHVIPLAAGGCDTAENMQWLDNAIKRCAGTHCKDRWERDVYAPDRRGE